jgi:galactoside O-acetyltransferase
MHLGERFYTDSELKDFGFKSLGRNVRIKRNAGIYFTENISIGDNVRVDDFTVIVASKEPVVIGSHVHIASLCYIAGSDGFVMEDFSGFSPGVLAFTGSDDYTGGKLTNPTIPHQYAGGPAGKIILGRHVIIGAGTILLPKTSLGEGCSVGAASLVKSGDYPPWGIYVGSPARWLKQRKKDLLTLEKKFLEEWNQ